MNHDALANCYLVKEVAHVVCFLLKFPFGLDYVTFRSYKEKICYDQ